MKFEDQYPEFGLVDDDALKLSRWLSKEPNGMMLLNMYRDKKDNCLDKSIYLETLNDYKRMVDSIVKKDEERTKELELLQKEISELKDRHFKLVKELGTIDVYMEKVREAMNKVEKKHLRELLPSAYVIDLIKNELKL